jgi:hypothetical protein
MKLSDKEKDLFTAIFDNYRENVVADMHILNKYFGEGTSHKIQEDAFKLASKLRDHCW